MFARRLDMTFGARAMALPGNWGKPDMAMAEVDDATNYIKEQSLPTRAPYAIYSVSGRE